MTRRLLLVAGLSLGLSLVSACSPPDVTTGWTVVPSAYAIDGDTFRQPGRADRYRLAWIDAPELPGHCRVGRACVPGNPYDSRAALQWYLDQPIRCRAISLDYYRRTLVECQLIATEADVGEQLIATGYAKPYERTRR